MPEVGHSFPTPTPDDLAKAIDCVVEYVDGRCPCTAHLGRAAVRILDYGLAQFESCPCPEPVGAPNIEKESDKEKCLKALAELKACTGKTIKDESDPTGGVGALPWALIFQLLRSILDLLLKTPVPASGHPA